MKKVLAVILAAVMCVMCAVPAVLAADGSYTKAHSVSTLAEQSKMFTIVPVDADSNYVADGGIF